MKITIDTLRDTLHETLRLFEEEESLHYRLIGTSACLMHGVPVQPGDVDFLARERGHVDSFARALGSFRCLTPPTWMQCAGQYYAAFDVRGVKVEASTVEGLAVSPFVETTGCGPWVHFSHIPVGDKIVPVVALELRLATELYRNREDRADAIVRWMYDHGCDQELLKNAMEARGINLALQHSVLSSISR